MCQSHSFRSSRLDLATILWPPGLTGHFRGQRGASPGRRADPDCVKKGPHLTESPGQGNQDIMESLEEPDI